MENPIKMDDLGVPMFFGNTQMVAAKQNLAVFVSASKLQDTWRIVPGIVSG